MQALTSASPDHALWAATTKGLWEIKLPGGGAFSDVLVDPTCPSRVYAAMGRASADAGGAEWRHGGGLWFSPDDGDSWHRLGEGAILDHVPITDLEMFPGRADTLFVATFGRGVWTWSWRFLQIPGCQGPQ